MWFLDMYFLFLLKENAVARVKKNYIIFTIRLTFIISNLLDMLYICGWTFVIFTFDPPYAGTRRRYIVTYFYINK